MTSSNNHGEDLLVGLKFQVKHHVSSLMSRVPDYTRLKVDSTKTTEQLTNPTVIQQQNKSFRTKLEQQNKRTNKYII